MPTDVLIAIGTCLAGVAAISTVAWKTLKYLVRKETQDIVQNTNTSMRDNIEARIESLRQEMEREKTADINERVDQLSLEVQELKDAKNSKGKHSVYFE